MEIYEITGDNLRVLLEEMSDPKDIHTVRIAIDHGEVKVKVKVNEYCWTYGLATRKP